MAPINAIRKLNYIPKAKLSNTDFSKLFTGITTDKFEMSTNGAVFSKATFEKAKEMVMESILGANPKESLVYIMNDKIIHYEPGDINSVKITDAMKTLLDDPKNRIAIVHSHPSDFSEMSAPLSYQDFISMNGYEGARSIYAINKQGEYSLLEKVSKQRPSFLKVLDYQKKLDNKIDRQNQKFNEEISDKIKSLLPENPTKEDLYLAFKLLIEKDPQFASKMNYCEMQHNLTIHNFWQKYASDLGVKYDTNYSCFA